MQQANFKLYFILFLHFILIFVQHYFYLIILAVVYIHCELDNKHGDIDSSKRTYADKLLSMVGSRACSCS